MPPEPPTRGLASPTPQAVLMALSRMLLTKRSCTHLSTVFEFTCWMNYILLLRGTGGYQKYITTMYWSGRSLPQNARHNNKDNNNNFYFPPKLPHVNMPCLSYIAPQHFHSHVMFAFVHEYNYTSLPWSSQLHVLCLAIFPKLIDYTTFSCGTVV